MPRISRDLHRIAASPSQFRSRREETSDSDDESDEDAAVSISAVSRVHYEVPSSTRKKNKKHTNEDGEEWKKSKQKEDIIAFLDNESGIQSMLPAQIFDMYTDSVGWEKQNAMANIRRLKKHW